MRRVDHDEDRDTRGKDSCISIRHSSKVMVPEVHLGFHRPKEDGMSYFRSS